MRAKSNDGSVSPALSMITSVCAVSPAAAISEIVYGNVFEGLVQFAADGSALPKLAAAWDISDDGLTYVFHLRPKVRFHDSQASIAPASTICIWRNSFVEVIPVFLFHLQYG